MAFDMKIKNEANVEIAELYFYGDIVASDFDKWNYEDTCPTEIRDFLKAHENKNLEIRINSCGGNCFGGIAIANMIKAHKGKTVAYVDGLCASIATVIASACDEIHLNKNSFFMVHRAWTYACGNVEDLQETIEVLEKMDKAILESYSKHLKDGVALEVIKDLMDKESWLCGEEVLDYFNFIIDEEEMLQAYAKVNKNFNYKNLPKQLLNKEEEEEKEEEKPLEEDVKVEEEKEVEKEEVEEEIPNEEEKPLEEEKEDEEIADKELDKEEDEEEKEDEVVEEEKEEDKCEKCGQQPCVCEEIEKERKEQEEKQALLDKAKRMTAYLAALEYLKDLK